MIEERHHESDVIDLGVLLLVFHRLASVHPVMVEAVWVDDDESRLVGERRPAQLRGQTGVCAAAVKTEHQRNERLGLHHQRYSQFVW